MEGWGWERRVRGEGEGGAFVELWRVLALHRFRFRFQARIHIRVCVYMCVCAFVYMKEKRKGKKSRKKRGNSLFRIFLIAVLLISPNRNPVNISRFILINPSNASPASFFLSFPCSPVAASFAQNSAHRSCAFSASCAEWSRSVVPKKTPCSRYIWKI